MPTENWKYKAYPKKQVEKLAQRVKSEWLAYKDREKVTQVQFAERLGITQPALNQFLSGTCPISNAMIITLTKELGVDPKKLVKGLSFFEPFFDSIVTARIVQVRYEIGATKTKEKKVTGTALHYHVHLPSDVDVYAVEIADNAYEPRYYQGEKVIVAAVEPGPADEAFIMRKDGEACLARFSSEDVFTCLLNVGRIFDGDNTRLPDVEHEIEYIHKVVGMTR